MRVIVVLVLVALARVALAGETDLKVTFEVAASEVPQYVCVIQPYSSCDSDPKNELKPNNSCSRPLASVAWIVEKTADGVPVVPVGESGVDRVPLVPAGTGATANWPPALVSAVTAIANAPAADDCAHDHDSCRSSIRVEPKWLSKDSNTSIICSNSNSAGREQRVAVLYVESAESTHVLNVSEIIFNGTIAQLVLTGKFPKAADFTLRVVGGDYSPSAPGVLGKNNRVAIPLHPRCSPYSIEMPPHQADLISQVELQGDTCVVGNPDVSKLDIRIPYTDDSMTKTLTVRTEKSVFKTSWSGPLPDQPVRLGVESTHFTWHPGCLAGAWPPTEQTTSGEWSARCPRVKLANFGEICELESDINITTSVWPMSIALVPACNYKCSARTAPPFTLPTPLHIERMRSQRGKAESIYAWDDTLHYAGEHSGSFVPAQDRRLIVDLDPNEWKDHWGNSFDEVRVVLPNGDVRNIDVTGASDTLDPWYAVSAPDLYCSDRIRLAVFGTRMNRERTLTADGGQIAVNDLQGLRDNNHWWLRTGIGSLAPHAEERPGATFRHFYPFVSVGIGYERYATTSDVPASFEAELSGDLGPIAVGVGQRGDLTTSFVDYGYERINLRVGGLLWPHTAVHFGVAGGVSLGVPLFNTNTDHLPAIVPSALLEVNGRINLSHRSGTWLEGAIGYRIHERHVYYESDVPNGAFSERHLAQFYFELRLRFRLQ